MKKLRNITLALGGFTCALILNHFNKNVEGFNFMLTFGTGLFVAVASFGTYLLVNDK